MTPSDIAYRKALGLSSTEPLPHALGTVPTKGTSRRPPRATVYR